MCRDRRWSTDIYIVDVLYIVLLHLCIFFFFKQKTAYEMRISDWSSDVCSSDLVEQAARGRCALPRLQGTELRAHANPRHRRISALPDRDRDQPAASRQ